MGKKKAEEEQIDPMEELVSVTIPGDKDNNDPANVHISGGNSWEIKRDTPTIVPRKVAEVLKNSSYPVQVVGTREEPIDVESTADEESA